MAYSSRAMPHVGVSQPSCSRLVPRAAAQVEERGEQTNMKKEMDAGGGSVTREDTGTRVLELGFEIREAIYVLTNRPLLGLKLLAGCAGSAHVSGYDQTRPCTLARAGLHRIGPAG
jgi:hypothetical protein